MELTTTESRGVEVIDIRGKVVGDAENCHKLHDLIQSLLGAGKTRFVVNLRDAPWMNSLGIGMLIGAYASVKNRGGELVMASATDRVRDLLRVTQLAAVFHLFDTADGAIEYLASSGAGRASTGDPARKDPPPDRLPA